MGINFALKYQNNHVWLPNNYFVYQTNYFVYQNNIVFCFLRVWVCFEVFIWDIMFDFDFCMTRNKLWDQGLSQI